MFKVYRNSIGLALLFLVATVAVQAAPIQITVMGGFPNTTPYGEVLYQYVDEYMKLNPNIEIVQLPRTGGDDTEMEKIYTSIAAGVAPDIVMVPQIFLTDYVAKRVVSPVPAAIQAKAKDAYLPAALFLGSYKNVLYGFPTEAQSQAIAYNSAVFAQYGYMDKAPSTWDELRAMAKKMTVVNADGTYRTVGFGGPLYQTLQAAWFLSFARSNGGDPLPADMSYVNFSRPESIAAAEYIRDMMQSKIAIQGRAGFAAGQMAMYLSPGSWHAAGYKNQGLGFFDGLRSAPLPVGSTGKSETTFYGYLWSVTPYTKNQTAAYDFLLWLCTSLTDRKTTRMGNVLEVQGNIPNTPWDAMNQPSFKHPFMKGFLEVVMNGSAKPIPPIPQWMASFGELNTQATRIFTGEVSAAEGMALVDKFIKEKMDEAKANL